MHSALKIFSNLCHFLLASDGFSVAHYKEGTAAMEGDEFSLLGSCLTNRVGMFTHLFYFVLLQLTARLNLLEEHPCFADNSQVFSPEESASYAPPSLTSHIPAFNAILSSSDQYLGQLPSKEEPADGTNSYSPFAEIGSRSNVLEEPVESLNYQKEPAISFGEIGDISVLMKVKKSKYKQCVWVISLAIRSGDKIRMDILCRAHVTRCVITARK